MCRVDPSPSPLPPLSFDSWAPRSSLTLFASSPDPFLPQRTRQPALQRVEGRARSKEQGAVTQTPPAITGSIILCTFGAHESPSYGLIVCANLPHARWHMAVKGMVGDCCRSGSGNLAVWMVLALQRASHGHVHLLISRTRTTSRARARARARVRTRARGNVFLRI